MAMNLNGPLGCALRALQLIFAIIVMGTDGYAIHVFRGHTVENHFSFGDFTDYVGVPSAWGFLMFCAGWTFLGVAFLLVAGINFTESALIDYIRVGVEAVGLLSWLAGFIAVAVNIGSNTCPLEENGCGPIKAATVFGALEWLLFGITTLLTVRLVFDNTRRPRASTAKTSTMTSKIPI